MAFKYFVLLANMRTGSNLFEQNIRLYDGFSCHGELFNPHFIGYPNVEELHGVTTGEREHKPQKLLNRFLAAETDTLPGFRLFSDHDPRVLDIVLNDPDCAKIVLTRNPLDSFVSHAIAQATDQWKLTDVAKRKKAKITFDISAFRNYLDRIQTYLTDIRRNLQHTGQAAFHIGYEELNDVNVFNGLVHYLGGRVELKELGAKIIRQNPEGLRDKVENYEEMLEQIRSIDLLATEAVPVLEPVRNPGSKNFVAGSDVPLLFMAMERGGHTPVARWLAAHQSGNVQRGMNQKQLADWLSENESRHAFTVLAHPLERAYRAFYRHIFSTGDKLFPWIRTTVENHYDVTLPAREMCNPPVRAVLENSGYGVEQHRQAFSGFLRFLKGNLQGLTRARVDQSWASQNAILQGYGRLTFADTLVREQSLAADLARIETQLGLPHVPVEPATDDHCFTLAEIVTPQMQSLARDAYARDFQMFGFSDWQ